jgi:hypothetical protein
MSDPIIKFLEHYLGEEERAARSAIEAGEPIWYSPSTGVVVVGVDNGVFDMITFLDGRTARHVVAHDPQSVLVDVVARQRIVGQVVDYLRENERLLEYDRGGDWHSLGSVMLLRLLAARYSAEAGYLPEWRVPGLDNGMTGGVSRVLDGELVQRELT